MKERIYKTMVQRYTSEIEDALLKIDMLMANSGSNAVMVNQDQIIEECWYVPIVGMAVS